MKLLNTKHFIIPGPYSGQVEGNVGVIHFMEEYKG